MNLYAPFASPTFRAAQRAQVGAPTSVWDALAQRRGWFDEAQKNAKKTYDAAMQTHAAADYESAFAANTAALNQAQQLKGLGDGALTIGTFTPEETATIQEHIDAAEVSISFLPVKKAELEADKAKHAPPPPVIIPTTPVDSEDLPDPDSPPPAPTSDSLTMPLLLVLGAVAVYALGPALVLRLFSKKG